MKNDTESNPSQSNAHSQPSCLRLLWFGLLLPLLAGAVVSCSSVKIQSECSPAAASPVSARHMMVVGLDERPVVRAQFEKEFVSQWQGASVECGTSHERFAFADLSGDREEIRRKLEQAGQEAVLVVRAKDRIKSNGAADGAESLYSSSATRPNSDGTIFLTFTPSATEATIKLVVTGKLFRVTDGAPLWSSTIQSTVHEGFDQNAVLHEFAAAIAKHLIGDKVFS